LHLDHAGGLEHFFGTGECSPKAYPFGYNCHWQFLSAHCLRGENTKRRRRNLVS
jgi:hypothetical protein